ncbi:hypothetical protein [Niveispirillum cyanobacteriorum]|uniref:hypothetical protein n=1 Tax=Niveispirillum cyanobacteriorum TaxID=1612173 RepID=UPI00131A458C|nr:hypothetical protein [Niveispirillum cyanobacteriorum]MBJ7416489.1 hypothetical protein [Niveispirillum sp.]GGE66331.1 hypothetical protein GCM10011317_24580 [Niveispirillum cyanobacteriorum]
MSAYLNAAAHDANDVLSGFRASLPTLSHAVEAVAIVAVAGFMAVLLNALF